MIWLYWWAISIPHSLFSHFNSTQSRWFLAFSISGCSECLPLRVHRRSLHTSKCHLSTLCGANLHIYQACWLPHQNVEFVCAASTKFCNITRRHRPPRFSSLLQNNVRLPTFPSDDRRLLDTETEDSVFLTFRDSTTGGMTGSSDLHSARL